MYVRMPVLIAALFLIAPGVVRAQAPEPATELRITLVGNAGVQLSDGATSLLVDLPYESGAFGYAEYRPADLGPPGAVVSVITHHHDDHFDGALFEARPEWRIIGPPSVTSGLPPERVQAGDSLRVGAFDVVAVPTPHTDDHRSYRIRWSGLVLHFTGDTEDPASLAGGPAVDLLFITPWLSCAVEAFPTARLGERSIAYHLQPSGADRVCGAVERLEQGSTFRVSAAKG
jgi:hypothetical protein